MLNKIGGLARAIYVILAIVGGFIALGSMNLPLILVVLGLIAGLAMPRDKLVLAMVAVVALPFMGTALATIPMIGAQLNTVMLNLQMGVAGASVTALMIMLFELVMASLTGLTGSEAKSGTAATA